MIRNGSGIVIRPHVLWCGYPGHASFALAVIGVPETASPSDQFALMREAWDRHSPHAAPAMSLVEGTFPLIGIRK